MFTFHRPKIFKSTGGCCICGAKSSSSRFTQSEKYESTFSECFDLNDEHRSGDICNACVLLVKRFRNKAGQTQQNWRHVVDARAGPGNRAGMRRARANMRNRNRQDRINADGEDSSDDDQNRSNRYRRSRTMKPKRRTLKCSPFLDLTFWRRKEICCGTIFIGANGEVMIDASLLNSCKYRTESENSEGSEASSEGCSEENDGAILENEKPTEPTYPKESVVDVINSLQYYKSTDF